MSIKSDIEYDVILIDATETPIERPKKTKALLLRKNVIGLLKRFKIIADRYRNRRKRFSLRFNLIAGIHNWELQY